VLAGMVASRIPRTSDAAQVSGLPPSQRLRRRRRQWPAISSKVSAILPAAMDPLPRRRKATFSAFGAGVQTPAADTGGRYWVNVYSRYGSVGERVGRLTKTPNRSISSF